MNADVLDRQRSGVGELDQQAQIVVGRGVGLGPVDRMAPMGSWVRDRHHGEAADEGRLIDGSIEPRVDGDVLGLNRLTVQGAQPSMQLSCDTRSPFQSGAIASSSTKWQAAPSRRTKLAPSLRVNWRAAVLTIRCT